VSPKYEGVKILMKKLEKSAFNKLEELGVSEEEIKIEFASYGKEIENDMFRTIIKDDNYAYELAIILAR
jgi:hypothetical protein